MRLNWFHERSAERFYSRSPACTHGRRDGSFTITWGRRSLDFVWPGAGHTFHWGAGSGAPGGLRNANHFQQFAHQRRHRARVALCVFFFAGACSNKLFPGERQCQRLPFWQYSRTRRRRSLGDLSDQFDCATDAGCFGTTSFADCVRTFGCSESIGASRLGFRKTFFGTCPLRKVQVADDQPIR